MSSCQEGYEKGYEDGSSGDPPQSSLMGMAPSFLGDLEEWEEWDEGYKEGYEEGKKEFESSRE